jgi:2-oxoglutarate ferredoxin oxidoreductase subunit gamma
MDKIRQPVVFNICVLGALLSLVPMVGYESVTKVLESNTSTELLDMNKKALELGRKIAEHENVGEISLF